ncbi:Uncharacterised protein [Mycobacterium tuberculosis]|nr:Uncharacterised protein [Mycobacterium tuberculosis]
MPSGMTFVPNIPSEGFVSERSRRPSFFKRACSGVFGMATSMLTVGCMMSV